MIGVRIETVDVELDDAGIEWVLRNDAGPVSRHMIKVGKRVVTWSKKYAGKDTGALRESIEMSRDMRFKSGYAIWVTAKSRHALVHHEGSRPHIISGKRGGMLSFRGKSGRVTVKSVRHPGTKANPFLVKALVKVLAR